MILALSVVLMAKKTLRWQVQKVHGLVLAY